ncbi:a-factor receptor [Tulasnella sp. 424]|nr:a-factor receptor [Tulasnella sp. 424]KAG8973443.1 a-factor receptor [Tulasnella sp. 425]
MASLITTSSFDPTYPTFPIFASLGIVLISLPAYWHFKSGNVGTILYIVWTFVGNLNYLINSIAWAGNLHNPPWFWCDLSTAITVALNVAIPTSSLLITHRLYSIATIRQVNISKSDSRRTKYYEIAVGLGLPALGIIFRVVVQGHRFDIIENLGCWPSIYVTPVTIPMVFLPPILINLVSATYASLAIRAFLKQRKQFSDLLQSANSGLTIGRYFRLMALAATEIICSLPMSTYTMVLNIQTGLHPWISWADTHYNFNRFEKLPFGWFKLFPRNWILINISRYSLPVGSFIFFIYLGMSGESGQFYRRQFWKVARLLGFPGPSSETSPGASWIARPGASAPSHLQSLPPFATAVSVTSTTKKETDSMELYAYGTGSKTNSSSDSLSVPPGSNAEKELEAEVDSLPRLPPSAEVHSSVV